MLCGSLFVFILLTILLSVLRFTDSDYPFGIFKLFLCKMTNTFISQMRSRIASTLTSRCEWPIYVIYILIKWKSLPGTWCYSPKILASLTSKTGRYNVGEKKITANYQSTKYLSSWKTWLWHGKNGVQNRRWKNVKPVCLWWRFLTLH